MNCDSMLLWQRDFDTMKNRMFCHTRLIVHSKPNMTIQPPKKKTNSAHQLTNRSNKNVALLHLPRTTEKDELQSSSASRTVVHAIREYSTISFTPTVRKHQQRYHFLGQFISSVSFVSLSFPQSVDQLVMIIIFHIEFVGSISIGCSTSNETKQTNKKRNTHADTHQPLRDCCCKFFFGDSILLLCSSIVRINCRRIREWINRFVFGAHWNQNFSILSRNYFNLCK